MGVERRVPSSVQSNVDLPDPEVRVRETHRETAGPGRARLQSCQLFGIGTKLRVKRAPVRA
jgi:hypothetical protein